MENPKAFASGHDTVSRVANKDTHTVAADLRLRFMTGGDALHVLRSRVNTQKHDSGGDAVSHSADVPRGGSAATVQKTRPAFSTRAPMAVAGIRESWDDGGLTFGQPSVGGGAEVRENPWMSKHMTILPQQTHTAPA